MPSCGKGELSWGALEGELEWGLGWHRPAG